MSTGFSHDPSQTRAFQALTAADLGLDDDFSGMSAVVIGGGTGAPVSVRTLLSLGVETSVVVAMADDGGSTGILRKEAHVTPPGDIRKCIAAMAADPMDPMTQAFKLRFEFARNHTLGNLMLSALEEVTGSFPEAIRICSDILGARGEVYPSTLNNITLFARTVQGAELRGQVNCGHSLAPLESVWLGQPDACVPYEAALDAVRNADLIVLGPGSLFTSIMPNLLVPGIREAIRDSYARTVFVCGLADMQGETKGMNVRQHVEALLRHGMKGLLDYVLVQDPTVTAALPGGHPVAMSAEDRAAIEAQGVRVVLRNLVDPEHPTWHYPKALSESFTEVLRVCRSHHR